MPHITVEYSANIKERPPHAPLLKKLHETLVATDPSYKMQDIKSRIIMHESFQVSDGTNNQSFVHLQLAIMPRPDDVKQKSTARLIEVLQAAFPNPVNCAFSAEVRELDKISYMKAVVGTI